MSTVGTFSELEVLVVVVVVVLSEVEVRVVLAAVAVADVDPDPEPPQPAAIRTASRPLRETVIGASRTCMGFLLCAGVAAVMAGP
jgi:hypothetical protein